MSAVPAFAHIATSVNNSVHDEEAQTQLLAAYAERTDIAFPSERSTPTPGSPDARHPPTVRIDRR